MKYDDASWHIGGDFPAGQPEEHGGTHIALFLKWCFLKGWAGPIFTEDEVALVVSGQSSATEFFFQHCDGKLVEEMLSPDGAAFAGQYYGDDGLYLDDYEKHFGKLMYVAPESAHDFAQFSAVLDSRLESGVLTKGKRPLPHLGGWSSAAVSARKEKSRKPWWKFW